MNREHLIDIGLARTQTFTVEETHSAAHLGSGTVSVLSTPSMILFMEITARSLLDEHLPDTHTTVGVHLDVRHLAACPIGVQVEARVGVIAVEGRKVQPSVEVWQGDKQLGDGQHARVIVDKARFLEKSNS